MSRTLEDRIRDLELKIESEISRINAETNSKATIKDLQQFKDAILEAYEDIKNDCRYLLKKLIEPKKKQENKLNKIFVIINIILVITNILIIIGGK